MFCFAKMCCLCLQHSADLFKLEEVDQHGVTFFEKLLVLIPGFVELVKKSIPNYICRKCKRYLNKFFKFQQICLKSYKLLESYVEQLGKPDEKTSQIEDNNPELHIIEDDLILIKEDMEECLKNMEIYIKAEENSNETPSTSLIQEEEPERPFRKENSPKEDTSRKRTRESKKISYNEDYDSDSILSDSESYYTKGAKRKAKPKKGTVAPKKNNKTVVIPQNDIFAKDLTKTLNDIITRLSANNANSQKPEEFKVKFKNSSGNTENLSIYQDKDTVEVKFTKEEKMGYLKVGRSGDSFILTHNISGSCGTSPLYSIAEELSPVAGISKENSPEEVLDGITLKKHVSLPEHMNLNEMSCKICDKTFENVTELMNHMNSHYNLEASSSKPKETSQSANTSEEPPLLDAGPQNLEVSPPTKEASSSPREISSVPKRAPSPTRSQCSEIKVVLSEIQETPINSERSSSPEYQFHLSDDSDDDFDDDTILLGPLDNENDFTDTRSPSPIQLGAEVLDFLQENDTSSPLKAPNSPKSVEVRENTPPREILKRAPSPLDSSPPFAGFPREIKKKTDMSPRSEERRSLQKGETNNEVVRISPRTEDAPILKRKKSNVEEISSKMKNIVPFGPENNIVVPNGKEKSPEPNKIQNNGLSSAKKPTSNGVDLNESFERKRLKIVIDKMEVAEYLIKNKCEETKRRRGRNRSSPQKVSGGSKTEEIVCSHCKQAFKTQRKLKTHLEKSHQIVSPRMEA